MSETNNILDDLNKLLKKKKFFDLKQKLVSQYNSLIKYNELNYIISTMFTRGYADKVVSIIMKLLEEHKEYNLFMLLGKAETICNNYEAALLNYQKAYRMNNNSVEAVFNIGVNSELMGKTEDAIMYFNKTLELKNDLPEALYNLGNIFRKQAEFEKAQMYYEKCLQYSPENADCVYNLGVVLEKQFKYAEAQEKYAEAIAFNPEMTDAHWNNAIVLLRMGNYKNGWNEFEWRLRKKEHQRNDLPFDYWNGENLNNKRLLIYDEQGFGDTIQFCRFTKILAKKYSVDISIECKAEIYPLLKNNLNYNNIFVRNEKVYSSNDFDYKLSFLSLPKYLGIDENNLGIKRPYIKADSEKKLNLSEGNKRKKIGIVWSGNPIHENDKYRSIKLSRLVKVLKQFDFQLFSLQKLSENDSANEILSRNNIVNLSPDIFNFNDTANFINGLDLVISVDTSAAHLAGAMMKSVWILLPKNSDWRWGIAGNTTAWYPTAKLFRQTKLGDWTDVFSRLKEELKVFEINDKQTQIDKILTKAIDNYNDKRFEKAAEYFETLTELTEDDETIHYNLAVCYQKLGQLDKAIASCNMAIEINNNYIEAYNTLAINYFQLGQTDKAIVVLEKALKKNPYAQNCLFNLANIYHRNNNLKQARKYYETAYTIKPRTPELIYNYALLLLEDDDFKTAETIVEHGLTEFPQEAAFYFLHGNIEKHKENFETAIERYLDAIKLEPGFVDAYLNLANTSYLLRNFNDAKKIYLMLKKENIEDARIDHSLGVLALENNEYNTAEKYFREAIKKNHENADFHIRLAEILFAKGDYKNGWNEFNWRFNKKEFVNQKTKLPNKLSDLNDKKILIYEEQGIGDTIQFIRFVKEIKTLNNNITLSVRKELHDLIAELNFVDEVVSNLVDISKYDYVFSLMSVAPFFIQSVSDIKSAQNYIDVKVRKKLKDKANIKIGICWRGNRYPVHNRKRHADIYDFEKLFSCANINYYCLQKDITKEEKKFISIFNNVEDLSPNINSFKDTAELLYEMDLIISVDTAVLHLAGSMGKDTWALLSYSPDWRWQIESDTSPWYPKMKLFRQNKLFDWGNVLTEVKNELEKFGKL